jgi:hypothetical protein
MIFRLPLSTAFNALLAISEQRTYHWALTIGSTMSLERLEIREMLKIDIKNLNYS